MSEENGSNSTIFVHLDNAAEKIRNVIESYEAGSQDHEQMEQSVNDALPDLPTVGIHADEEGDTISVNNKEVPKNYGSAVYFYTDDDGTLRATVELPDYEHGKVFGEYDSVPADQLAGLEFLALVRGEHSRVIEQVLMHMAMQQMVGMSGGNDGDDGDNDDPLSAIEDEDTREQVRKLMH